MVDTSSQYFPGRFAGASLKHGQASSISAAVASDFPGRFAGASLKQEQTHGAIADPGLVFPRQIRRGLVEA